MDMHQRERTQITRPVAPPVDLDRGRLDLRRAAGAAGFTFGALMVATLGSWLVVGSVTIYGVNWIGVVLGGSIAVIALVFGSVVLYVSITEWTDYRARVRDWHDQALWERQQSGGAETIEHVSEWELTTSNPAHVLLAALCAHMRHEQGESAPWAVRKQIGPVFVAGRRVGDISKGNAELMSQQFARIGLVDGRAPGVAGEWTPRSADEVLHLVVKNWRQN